MLVITIEGFGVSSFPHRWPMSEEIERFIPSLTSKFAFTPYLWKRKIKTIQDVLSFEISNQNLKEKQCVIAAKSMGAYRFLNSLYCFDELLSFFTAVSIITVDPHCPFGICDSEHPINLKQSPKYHNIRIWNIFQNTFYPTGSEIISDRYLVINRIIPGSTHSTIVSNPFAFDIYRDAVNHAAGIKPTAQPRE